MYNFFYISTKRSKGSTKHFVFITSDSMFFEKDCNQFESSGKDDEIANE